MDRTEKLIADAFEQLLEEKPIIKITVREITERCCVNRNTFYYHFQDIPTLCGRLIKEKADTIIQSNNQLESLPDCIQLVIQYCTAYRQAILHIYRSIQREAFLDALDRLALYAVRKFVNSATAGLSIQESDQELLIHYYKCTLIGISLDWLNAGMSYDLLSATTRVCHLFSGSSKSAFLKCAEESTGQK